MAGHKPYIVPEGWEAVTTANNKGEVVKYYTNVLGQRFYSEADLERNIRDSKERGLSIYAADFNASHIAVTNSQGRKKKSAVGESSARASKKRGGSSVRLLKTSTKQKSLEKQLEKPGTSSGPQPSETGTGTSMGRTSRRLAGLQPELTTDLELNKALEYIIK